MEVAPHRTRRDPEFPERPPISCATVAPGGEIRPIIDAFSHCVANIGPILTKCPGQIGVIDAAGDREKLQLSGRCTSTLGGRAAHIVWAFRVGLACPSLSTTWLKLRSEVGAHLGSHGLLLGGGQWGLPAFPPPTRTRHFCVCAPSPSAARCEEWCVDGFRLTWDSEVVAVDGHGPPSCRGPAQDLRQDRRAHRAEGRGASARRARAQWCVMGCCAPHLSSGMVAPVRQRRLTSRAPRFQSQCRSSSLGSTAWRRRGERAKLDALASVVACRAFSLSSRSVSVGGVGKTSASVVPELLSEVAPLGFESVGRPQRVPGLVVLCFVCCPQVCMLLPRDARIAVRTCALACVNRGNGHRAQGACLEQVWVTMWRWRHWYYARGRLR